MLQVRDVELLSDAGAALAESPQWDADADRLLWVDIDPGIVHRLDLATGEDRVTDLGPTVGAVAPRVGGGLVVARRAGFRLLDDDGAIVSEVQAGAGGDGTRMNDGKCDPAGRFWAGSMVTGKDGTHAALFRLDADLSVQPVVEGVTVSNGLAWSLDGTLLYYIDSVTGGVDAFDFDLATGQIARRRRLVSIPAEEGEPDGMTVDADGCLWVALWGGGQVRRYTPDGRLDAMVELPVSLVTSCCFAGSATDTLVITTASSDLTPQQRAAQPLAGGLFAVDVGTSGFAATPFGG